MLRWQTVSRTFKKGLSLAIALSLLIMSGCTGPADAGENPATSAAAVDEESNLSMRPVDAATGQVNFAIRDGLPLFKKYSYFLIGDTPFDRVNHYAYYLEELRARNVRFSLTVQSTEDEPLLYKKNMKDAMWLFGDAISEYAIPYWHMSYVRAAVNPTIAQTDPDNAVYYEPDYAIWNNAWKTAAEYFREESIRCCYEVWNEPDQQLWTKFDFNGYIRMYQNTAKALREGNPDAFVGGLAASHLSVLGLDKLNLFLDSVASDNTPIDFVSLHDYDQGYLTEVPQLQAALRARPYYDKTQIHYTEFNIYNVPYSEWYLDPSERTDFTLQNAVAAPMMLTAIDKMNGFTDVSVVQWAALMDGSGAFSVISPDGKRTPAYHVQRLYMHMPVERVQASTGNAGVQIMASADETVAAVMLWNPTDSPQNLSINLNNIPFAHYSATVSRIDSEHSSYRESASGSDELAVVESHEGLSTCALSWNGTIPANGTVYIELDSGEPHLLDNEISVGTVVRTDNYYKQHGQNAYGDFDELTSTALIGTGDSENGRGCVAVTYDQIKDTIQVSGKLRGDLRTVNSDSGLIVRVDYQTPAGYTRAVEYKAGVTSCSRSTPIPFGSGEAAHVVVPVDFNNFEMDIRGYAPADWTGRVILTFDIENTGAWTEAKLALS